MTGLFPIVRVKQNTPSLISEVLDVGAGGIQAPIASLTLSNENPQPSPCFAMLKVEAEGIVYDKALTHPTQSIWNCNPKNVIQLTAAQQAQIAAI